MNTSTDDSHIDKDMDRLINNVRLAEGSVHYLLISMAREIDLCAALPDDSPIAKTKLDYISRLAESTSTNVSRNLNSVSEELKKLKNQY